MNTEKRIKELEKRVKELEQTRIIVLPVPYIIPPNPYHRQPMITWGNGYTTAGTLNGTVTWT